MKTYIPNKAEIEQKWYLVDLDGATLGRAAVKVAGILRGKNKPNFTPHIDTGDYVVAINAAKLKILKGFLFMLSRECCRKTNLAAK